MCACAFLKFNDHPKNGKCCLSHGAQRGARTDLVDVNSLVPGVNRHPKRYNLYSFELILLRVYFDSIHGLLGTWLQI